MQRLLQTSSSYQIVLRDSVYRIYFGAFDHRIITLTDYRTRGRGGLGFFLNLIADRVLPWNIHLSFFLSLRLLEFRTVLEASVPHLLSWSYPWEVGLSLRNDGRLYSDLIETYDTRYMYVSFIYPSFTNILRYYPSNFIVQTPVQQNKKEREILNLLSREEDLY